MLARRARQRACISANATARCSAATRRSSRSRPRPSSTPRCATSSVRRRSRSPGAPGTGRRHRGVPGRAGRRVVVPRDERAAAGGASGHRGRDGRRPRACPALDRRRGDPLALDAGRRPCSRPRDRGARVRGGPRERLPAHRRPGRRCSICPTWPGVRIDTALRAGDEVGLGFDPLLAKVIAWAEDRPRGARAAAVRARRRADRGRDDEPRVPARRARPDPRSPAAPPTPTGSSGHGAPTCPRCPAGCTPRATRATRGSRSGPARRCPTEVTVAGSHAQYTAAGRTSSGDEPRRDRRSRRRRRLAHRADARERARASTSRRATM